MNALTSGIQIGSYELLDLISRTNMGEVWRARNATGQIVAVKTISTEAAPEPALLSRSLHEGAAHQTLQHPYIVPILDFFDLDDKVYLVMEYVAGGSLEDRLETLNGQPMPVLEAIRIARQVLAALDHAHRRGIIHRDVKPSNILLNVHRAQLTDFGIALTLGRPRLTTITQVLGTEYYMSPEQICKPLEVTHLADVYSFGCVLYEMLAGRPPFLRDEGSSKDVEYQVLTKHVNEEAAPLRQWNPDVPPRLERIVATSLAKNPEDRFPGCGSFERALASVEEEITAPEILSPAPLEEIPTPPAPKRPQLHLPAPVRPVHAFTNVAAVLAAVLVPLLFAGNRQYLPLVVVLACLAANSLLLRLWYKAWSAIQDPYTRITPGKAVGYLFIPVYGLYWAGRTLAAYAREHNAFVARYHLPVRPQRAWLYLVFLVIHVSFAILMRALPNPAMVGFWLLFDYWVLVPVMAAVLARAINRLAKSIEALRMTAAPPERVF
jgi:eukaryotic-like serine/threonine-protein kinase